MKYRINAASVVAAGLLSACAYKPTEISQDVPPEAQPNVIADANSQPFLRCKGTLLFPGVLGTGSGASADYMAKIAACMTDPKGGQFQGKAPDDLPRLVNMHNMDWYWGQEAAQYNRGDRAVKRPRRCLALSGGGIRSGAFSIGVMKAFDQMFPLDDTGKVQEGGASFLQSFDIISSVSGGSYASSWYLTQRQAQLYGDDSPFAPSPDTQKAGLNRLGWDPIGADGKLVRTSGALFHALGSLVLAPVNLAANGVLGTHANTSLNPLYYQDKLHRIFHDKQGGNGHAPWTMGNFSNLAERPTMPYFIFNTTASNRYYNEQRYDQKVRTYKRLYETYGISTRHMGNARFGYTDAAVPYRDMELSRIIAMSGAAGDTMTMSEHWLWPRLLSVLNWDLGQYIDNYAKTDAEKAAVKWKYMPFPLHFMYFDTHGGLVTDIYMSDGGHSENLGFYSLIERGCEKIVVVDGERDPGYKFKSLSRLRWKLKRVGIDMNFPALMNNDAHLDIDNVYDEGKAISIPKDQCAYRDIDGVITNLKKPVFYGTIENLPVHSGQSEIKLTYIKLSIDPDKVAQPDQPYGPNVKEQFDESGGKTSKFPHPPTTDQNYPPLMFNALRDLGCTIVKNEIDPRRFGAFGFKANATCLYEAPGADQASKSSPQSR